MCTNNLRRVCEYAQAPLLIRQPDASKQVSEAGTSRLARLQGHRRCARNAFDEEFEANLVCDLLGLRKTCEPLIDHHGHPKAFEAETRTAQGNSLRETSSWNVAGLSQVA